MAKQTKEVKKFEFTKVGNILDNIAKTVPVQIEKEIKEKTFITTGVYLLDAALSGKLLGGGVSLLLGIHDIVTSPKAAAPGGAAAIPPLPTASNQPWLWLSL